MKKRVPFAVVLMLATAVFVQAADNMKVFPPAEKGMVRDESLLKVELIVGKTVPVDQKNR